MGFPWFITISPIAAGRVFLNLRAAVATKSSPPVSRVRSFDAAAEGFRARSRQSDPCSSYDDQMDGELSESAESEQEEMSEQEGMSNQAMV